MQYMNQTIVFLSEENKDLKQKVRKLESICKNIIEVNNIQNENLGNKKIGSQVRQRSAKSQQRNLQIFNDANFNKGISQYQQINTKKKDSLDQYISKFQVISPKNNSNNDSKRQQMYSQTQINYLKNQIQTLQSQLNILQLQSLQKSNKLKSLTKQLYKYKQQFLFLQKSQKQQIQNLKKYYEIILVKQIEQKYQNQKQTMINGYQKLLKQKNCQINQIRLLAQRQGTEIMELGKCNQDMKNKQNKLMKIIKEMKSLMETRQKQYEQQLETLKKQLKQKTQFLSVMQEQLKHKSLTLFQLQSQNQNLSIDIKKLTKQISTLKRQHSRSISKSQRQLIRQRSMTKILTKNFQVEKKYLEGEIKKKQMNQKYHIKKQKELINKIKSMEFEDNDITNEQISVHNVNDKSSLYINQETNDAHKSPNLQCPKSTKSKQFATPKQSIKLKSNTISVINTKKSTSNSNLSFIQQSNKTPKRIQKITNKSYVSTMRNSPERSSSNIDSSENLLSICLKDNKYKQSLKSSHKNINLQKTLKVKTSKNRSIPSQESLQINSCSQIDFLKDNLSYFPSTKSSCKNSEQKSGQNNRTYCRQFNENTIIKQLSQQDLQRHMRTSFNPNIYPPHHVKSVNHKINSVENVSSIPKNTKINYQTQNVVVSQFQLYPEEDSLQQTNQQRINMPQMKQKYSTKQKQIINKMLKTQESNQKDHQNTKNIIDYQKIREKLSAMQDGQHKNYIFSSRSNTQIEELLIRNQTNQNSLPQTKRKSFREYCQMNKKSKPTIITSNNCNTLQQEGQNLYKPSKQMLKLSDLDTPCFQSSKNSEKELFQTMRNHQNKQTLKYGKCQTIKMSKQRNFARQDNNMTTNANNHTPASKTSRKISINIHKFK